MSADDFIDAAVKKGGLAALTGVSRKVWLISEAELYCATNGIDTFLEKYTAVLGEAAEAFSAVGAEEIGTVLQTVHAGQPQPAENLLDEAERLINTRTGYDSRPSGVSWPSPLPESLSLREPPP